MFCELKTRALLHIKGVDCKSFLQSQLSNDINKINKNTIQINAYCQHQGKILAIFWVMQNNKDFFISFPLDLLDKILNRLRMFVLNLDVVIEDITSKYRQIGFIDSDKKENYFINSRLSLQIVKTNHNVNLDLSDECEWNILYIKSLLAEVFHKTTEKFVPQMLNLDINELGVSFSKGCYPGQEIVARLHYLGKAKRRLFIFECQTLVEVGNVLYCKNSKSHKASGIVVSQVKCASDFVFLATIEVTHKDDIIRLNSHNGAIVKRIKEY